MKNRKCKYCGKEFHACSSCGLTNDWEYRYCSDECYFASPEYVSLKDKVRKYTAFFDLGKLITFLDEFEEYDNNELLIAIRGVEIERALNTTETSRPCPYCTERGDTINCSNKYCMNGVEYFCI